MPDAFQIKHTASGISAKARRLRTTKPTDIDAIAKQLADLAACVGDLADGLSDLTNEVNRLK
jgi:hypothetical protein